MLKQYIVLTLIGLIINLTLSSFVFAQTGRLGEAEKVKIKVAKIGIGGKQTEVKFKDRTKIRGYITEIKDDYFVLVSKKDGASNTIYYDKVDEIRRYQKFTTFQKIALGTGIAFGAMFLIVGICVAAKSCVE